MPLSCFVLSPDNVYNLCEPGTSEGGLVVPAPVYTQLILSETTGQKSATHQLNQTASHLLDHALYTRTINNY